MAATESLMEGGQATYAKNGDKVNFELQPKNIGLTKEQLESYRNDPFWKPVRTVLFAVFWLSWLLMFAAAIAIVVFSPKCAEKEQPVWFQTQVAYQISLPSFRDSNGDGVGDFNGVTEKLDLLRKIGVTTIHLSPIVQIDQDLLFDTYAVTDHESIDERFGTEEELKNLIAIAHDKDMHVVMDLPATTVSKKHPWFAKGEEKYFATATPDDDYYGEKEFHEWAGKNATKYLGAPDGDHPVLEWNFDLVRVAVIAGMQKYRNMGIDGFHFGNVRDVAGLKVFKEEEKEGALSKAQSVIKMMATIILDKISSKEVKENLFFFASLDAQKYARPETNEHNIYYIVDDSFTKFKLSDCSTSFAECVENHLKTSLEIIRGSFYTQYWQFENAATSRLSDRFDSESSTLMTMLQLCMPGAISLRYGQELGMRNTPSSKQNNGMRWSSEPHSGFSSASKLAEGIEVEKNGSTFDEQYSADNSMLKIVQKLAKLRQRDEVFSLGTVEVGRTDDVLVIGRHFVANNSTSTGHVYLGLFNFGTESSEVKFADYKNVLPDKNYDSGEIVVVTKGLPEFRSRQKVDFAGTVSLPAKQAVLVKF